MLRARWVAAVLAGGLGLLSGCSSLRDHPWFSRSRPAPTEGYYDPSTLPISQGPILDGGPPIVAPPNGLPANGATAQPPCATPLRPVPQPQAQPVPAEPSRRTPGLFIDRWKN